MSTIRQTFEYLDPGLLIDQDLQLVQPALSWVDPLLQSCRHPLTQRDMPVQAKTTRDQLLSFLEHNPRGFARGDPWGHVPPTYTFWMRLRPDPFAPPPIPFAGSISLRLGFSLNLDLYLGHVGYHVLPPARGRHYAARACRLVLPLARAYGFTTLWITTNPENLSSRKTCERLGATLIDTISVPPDNPLYQQGDRQKCRYRLDL